ncbi:hypothetical protein LPJ77_005186 [Coemansia sp. RSA 2523]|nr:hypothetical protein LPJ77_005186 [Coemansia sp. RSA 2523]KAJ2174204.1 hypothetical protein GGH16_001428 [Coemansia sp. RSA 560]KAJ2178953.1 hypothetical protein GGF45_002625 [Coemansia sp. RSA 551]KAJ2221433.1 hypothetical protein IW143_001826 [Coemansia sp. RSA 520]KAJ2411619.1 hypothetical protein GGF47_006250 [Coemansia sp. RSA 2524]
MKTSALGVLWAMAGVAFGDIVLSVATPTNMNEYLDVLSHAWPTLHSKLDAQLQIAQSEVPAEHSFLLNLLGISNVPSEYDNEWAQQFISNAQKIGATTIDADNIPNAEDVQPTYLLTTNSEGDVGVLENVEVERPIIIVAVNGNVERVAHSAEPTDESQDESSEDSEVDSESDESGAVAVKQWLAGVAVAALAVLV